MQVAAYIRVSDLSQVDGYSLDAQERFNREFCELKGWALKVIFREEGVSARSDAVSKRPALQQLLCDAEAGKFDIVIVHTLDRWARNLKVMLETLSFLGSQLEYSLYPLSNLGLVSTNHN